MKTKETLREVGTNLWVSDYASAQVIGEDFDLTVQCITDVLTFARGTKHLEVTPSGKTNHSWTEADLNRIVFHAIDTLGRQGSVLIYCNRGRSRSACAAAAVLLASGEASDVQEALKKVSHNGSRPATTSIGGLNRWWRDRNR